ncbi:unnamed protein product [Moneuplotes crassus]|uniref:Uncharacterized protein n=1 Tax=Euplotes crassus TaxID=5936 RepID=A0AAD1XCQ5_EUPCR|nr:unnamed protein product [Moneuplotes crassus]
MDKLSMGETSALDVQRIFFEVLSSPKSVNKSRVVTLSTEKIVEISASSITRLEAILSLRIGNPSRKSLNNLIYLFCIGNFCIPWIEYQNFPTDRH